MTELLERRLREIDELSAQGGWHADGDMIPTLYLLMTEELTPAPIAVTDELWQLPLRPGQQLMLLARLVESQDHLRDRLEAPVRGLIYATEAWTVTADREDEEELLEFSRERKIRQHPRRVETRLTVGTLSDGTVLAMSHTRGGAIEMLGETPDLGGEVPQGLRELMTALLHGGTNN